MKRGMDRRACCVPQCSHSVGVTSTHMPSSLRYVSARAIPTVTLPQGRDLLFHPLHQPLSPFVTLNGPAAISGGPETWMLVTTLDFRPHHLPRCRLERRARVLNREATFISRDHEASILWGLSVVLSHCDRWGVV